MRYISPALKARIEKANQTIYENANPSMTIWLSRQSTVLKGKTFLERQVIGSGNNITNISIACRRPLPGKQSDRIYVAFVDNGVGKIMYAEQNTVMSKHIWNSVSEIDDVTDISIVFDGVMKKNIKGRIDFLTIGEPWIFWTNSEGRLQGKNLESDETLITLAASNTTAVSAVRGTHSESGDIDQGLIVFFISNGGIYYRSYIRGDWVAVSVVDFGPSRFWGQWVDISASRTWDYRICLQVNAPDGNIYEYFTYSAGIAKQNVEHIDISNISASANGIPIIYNDVQDVEKINISNISANAKNLYAFSPIVKNCMNIDDGEGNWGLYVIAEFDYPVTNIFDNAQNFNIIDEKGIAYSGQTIEYATDYRTIKIGFIDFNNAYNEQCTLNYIQGTVEGPSVLLESFNFAFNPINLVPTIVPMPEVEAIWNE